MNPFKMKIATSVSLIIMLFCFASPYECLADTCLDKNDDFFQTCSKFDDHDYLKSNIRSVSLERESRMVNVRERVGTERLVNNRRIVDSDSRISNFPIRSAIRNRASLTENHRFPRLVECSRDLRVNDNFRHIEDSNIRERRFNPLTGIRGLERETHMPIRETSIRDEVSDERNSRRSAFRNQIARVNEEDVRNNRDMRRYSSELSESDRQNRERRDSVRDRNSRVSNRNADISLVSDRNTRIISRDSGERRSLERISTRRDYNSQRDLTSERVLHNPNDREIRVRDTRDARNADRSTIERDHVRQNINDRSIVQSRILDTQERLSGRTVDQEQARNRISGNRDSTQRNEQSATLLDRRISEKPLENRRIGHEITNRLSRNAARTSERFERRDHSFITNYERDTIKDENNNDRHIPSKYQSYNNQELIYKKPIITSNWSSVISATLGILLIAHIITSSSESKQLRQLKNFMYSTKEKVL